jgi:hypothetical protein
VADPVAAPEPADQDVAAGAVHERGREPRRATGEAAVPGHSGAHSAPHAAQQQDQQELINRRSSTEFWIWSINRCFVFFVPRSIVVSKSCTLVH